MWKKKEITAKEYQEVLQAIKKNTHKRIDRKLQAIKMRYEGFTLLQISEKLSCTVRTVTNIITAFKASDINEFTKLKYGGNHRLLSEEEEDEILAQFDEKMNKGQIVTVKEIKQEFDKRIGKDTGGSYIYALLKRKNYRKVMPRSKHPKKANEEEIEISKKKIKASVVESIENNSHYKNIRLMFQDEAGFGRISKPRYCWARKGVRPHVPSHYIREYRYAYGAVEPITGDNFFLIMPYCDTSCMNIFLEELSNQCKEDYIILVCDGAVWHKSKGLKIPPNIKIMFIPPYTPEMNPIEQIWKEIRTVGFKNEIFPNLNKVIDRLSDTICKLTKKIVNRITKRDWIVEIFTTPKLEHLIHV